MSGTYKTLREWPYGLLDELYGKEGAEYELPDDFEGTIQYVLCMLPQKDREVLKARYEGRLSLEDMAGMFGVTRERIRQVLSHALWMLKQPKPMAYIRLGVSGMVAGAERRAEAARRLQKTTEAEPASEKEAAMYATPISVLMLGARANNCLLRRGISTIGALMRLTAEELMNIRNLGLKTYDEIVDALERAGYDVGRFGRADR